MAMAAANFGEMRTIIDQSIKIHPEIITVVLAVDLNNFAPIQTDESLSESFLQSPKINSSEIASALL